MFDRRSFLKLSSAFPVTAVTAALVVRKEGKESVELDVSVLRTQPGDVVVLTAPGPISETSIRNLETVFKATFPDLKAIVLGDGLKVDGVLRT